MISAEPLSAIEHLRQSDPALRAVVDRIEVPRLESTGNVYEDALSCVLDMRIHYTPTASTASWNAGNPTPPSRRATCTGFVIQHRTSSKKPVTRSFSFAYPTTSESASSGRA